MYKRAARVLFVSDDGHFLNRLAELCALQESKDWLEPKSAGLTSTDDSRLDDYCQQHGLPQPAPPTSLTEELKDWADLIIQLPKPLPLGELPKTTRAKHWSVPDEQNPHEHLIHQVQCMVGGLKMLSRMDAESSHHEKNQ